MKAQGPLVLMCPEPFRERIQGIGIRFLEMGRELQRLGRDVFLAIPNEDGPAHGDVPTVCLGHRSFRDVLRKASAVVLHGHVSEHYFTVLEEEQMGEGPPLVVDLYDPFLIENLQYTPLLGDHVFYRDRAVLFRQLRRGDFFVAASEEQRLFYIGIMVGLERIQPHIYHEDTTLRRLIDTAPFGVHPVAPERMASLPGKLKGVVSGINPGDVVLFFGGVYDWYDPMVLLEAMRPLVEEGLPLRAVFCQNPNPATTPQERMAQVCRWADAAGWSGRHVFFVPWFPYDERFHYYRDADVAISLHRPSLEADLSLRTRLLDFMNAGLPLIVTEGGEGARKVREVGCGRVVRPFHADDVRNALRFYLEHPDQRKVHGDRGRRWVHENMSWSRVLGPVVRFCAAPAKAPKPFGSGTWQGGHFRRTAMQRLYELWRYGAVHGFKAMVKRAWRLEAAGTPHGIGS